MPELGPNRLALVVEDDRLSAMVLEDWLKGRGWTVERAESGTEGLRRFSELHPKLVLADVVLPGLDGIGLCGELRLQPFSDRLWIGLMSSRPTVRDRALAAGGDFFIQKPIRFEELAAALEKLEQASEPVVERDLRDMAPVRVPSAPVLGESEQVIVEEGELAPALLLPLLRSLWDHRFTGVLEAFNNESGGQRVKVFFDRGCPSAARSNDHSTGFARILQSLNVASADVLEASIVEARRLAAPVGEVLLRNGLVDFHTIERAMREQIIARTMGIRDLGKGRYTLQAAEPMGLAGFDVHPAVLEWRLGVPGLIPENYADLFVALQPIDPWIWTLIDPDNHLRPLVLVLRSGATVRTCESVSGYAHSLISILLRYHLASLSHTPPALQREPAPARESVDGVEEDLAQRLRTALDATHYTVLGVRPGADSEDIHSATVALLAKLRPEALPARLSPEGRERARQLADRIREAGRVLGDASRRAIYDVRLTADNTLTITSVEVELRADLQADRAREHFRRNEYVTAAALFQLALKLEAEEDAEILAMLGWARHRACPEDPLAGEPELKRSLALEPDNEFGLYYLGRLAVARGNKEEGRRLLRRAVSVNHEFEAARKALKQLETE